jgi:hypothetical protein
MIIWHNLHQFVPQRFAAASQPCAIEVGGVVLGTTVMHKPRIRFIAAGGRAKDMDQSIWPSFKYAEASARQMFRSARSSSQR